MFRVARFLSRRRDLLDSRRLGYKTLSGVHGDVRPVPENAGFTARSGLGRHFEALSEVDLLRFTRDSFANDDSVSNEALIAKHRCIRRLGHLTATLDPLNRENPTKEQINTRLLPFLSSIPDAESDPVVQAFVGRGLGIEIDHVESEREYAFLAYATEQITSGVESYLSNDSDNEYLTHCATQMAKCQAFDHFLAKRFPAIKRYGGEGAESMVSLLEQVLASCQVSSSVRDVIVCMPHRGRLNFLTTLLEFPSRVMFDKMRGVPEFPSAMPGEGGSSASSTDSFNFEGDVLSHLYRTHPSFTASSTTHALHRSVTFTEETPSPPSLRVSLIPNPSHLEGNNPVSAGKARARMQQVSAFPYSADGEIGPVLCLQIHGDASFSCQGVVAETFQLSNLPHYTVNGSIHLIVNNQIGYTTEGERGRSSRYCSDLAKMIAAPVIHVNGDCASSVAAAAVIAAEYRNTFSRDIILDLVCYRQHGHNEMDDPTFTQPDMYKSVKGRPSIPDKLASSLGKQIDISSFKQYLNDEYKISTGGSTNEDPKCDMPFRNRWQGVEQASRQGVTQWDTGVDTNILNFIGRRSVTALPEGFNLHPTLLRSFVKPRLSSLGDENRAVLNWATAEALAFGSLALCDGHDVRISGQDVGRGTFSQRHAMLVDQRSEDISVPLNHLLDGSYTSSALLDDSSSVAAMADRFASGQSSFLEVCNSPLSEEAVLGFEYGFSLDSPSRLVLWEAQFGDFFNTAQPIFDTFILASESKWLLQSGLVVLLPHGMDGAGPEHSSCRIERFLSQSDSSETSVDPDDVAFSFGFPTTPAQYFHLLRRQQVRPFRKPLIVASPKGLLRDTACLSSISDMAPGTTFHPVLDDDTRSSNPASVKRVILCSGKHFYALKQHRDEMLTADAASKIALIRLEQLCPFPAHELNAILTRYPCVSTGAPGSIVWSQEEHRNQGCWSFVASRLRNLLGVDLTYAGRDVCNQPATGIAIRHKAQLNQLLKQSFE